MPNKRPAADEYAPYYHTYIGKVPDGDVLAFLSRQHDTLRATISPLPPATGAFAYAPGKWTLNEALQHVIDAERVFTYRALRIGRGDTVPLAGFEQNDWVPLSGANDRTLASILDEFSALRASTTALFRGLPLHAWSRRGTASNNPVTTRALAWICAGHALHHEGIIRERYLGAS